MTNLTLGTSAIRELDGLFSLNDLHKASGGNPSHRPANFLRLEQAQALVAEIQSSEMSVALKTSHGGRNGSQTYACRELVIAYAAWISPAFHLKVIRVFLDASAPALPSAPITDVQAGELATLIAERFPDGRHRPYAWGRFNAHFRIARYRELPASRFAEACAYIRQMPGKEPPALPDPGNQLVEARRKFLEFSRKLPEAEQKALDDKETLNQIADGYLAYSLTCRRWLVSFDCRGQIQQSPLADDAFVFSCAKLPDLIRDPAAMFSTQSLVAISAACTERLADKLKNANEYANHGRKTK